MFYICLQESIDFPIIIKIIVKPQLKTNHLSTRSINQNNQNNLVLIAADLHLEQTEWLTMQGMTLLNMWRTDFGTWKKYS